MRPSIQYLVLGLAPGANRGLSLCPRVSDIAHSFSFWYSCACRSRRSSTPQLPRGHRNGRGRSWLLSSLRRTFSLGDGAMTAPTLHAPLGARSHCGVWGSWAGAKEPPPWCRNSPICVLFFLPRRRRSIPRGGYELVGKITRRFGGSGFG